MANLNDAIRAFGKVLVGKQDTQEIRFALTGDGSSSSASDVDGRPGWTWVRYDDEPDRVSQVRNDRLPEVPQGIPVVIGKLYPIDRVVQILGINKPLYDLFIGDGAYVSYLLPKHGDSHHATLGADPAYIDIRNLLNGRVRPNSPSSSSVYIESFAYNYNGERVIFPGGGVDLAGDFPGETSSHRYVLISVDTITGGPRKTPGSISPITVAATPPDVPLWYQPLAVILLKNGDSVVIETDIHDYRMVIDVTNRPYESLLEHMAYMERLLTKHLAGDV